MSKKLNFEILMPRFTESEDFLDAVDRGEYQSLTNDDYYFLDNYSRLDTYVDSLPIDEQEELFDAANRMDDAAKELFKKHEDAELLSYAKSMSDAKKDITSREDPADSIVRESDESDFSFGG